MARGTLTKAVKALWGREKDQMKGEINNIIDELDALYAKLDGDVGITDVNYADTLDGGASKIP